jgi:hypothetical protein
MIKSVVAQHHWSPREFGDLFIDNVDHLGLVFWYEAVREYNAKKKE